MGNTAQLQSKLGRKGGREGDTFILEIMLSPAFAIFLSKYCSFFTTLESNIKQLAYCVCECVNVYMCVSVCLSLCVCVYC